MPACSPCIILPPKIVPSAKSAHIRIIPAARPCAEQWDGLDQSVASLMLQDPRSHYRQPHRTGTPAQPRAERNACQGDPCPTLRIYIHYKILNLRQFASTHTNGPEY